MDGFNQALLVSFFSAAAFTFGLPFVLQRMKYELALAGQVYFDGKNKTVVLGKAALIFVGGGLLLAWLMLQLVDHFDSQLEFSSGESYRRADTYAWIARHWVFAFAVGGIIAFKLVAESVNYLLDKEEAKDKLKAAYGAKSWATFDEVKAVVPLVRGGHDNKAIGIHIGGAHFWNGMGHMLTVGGSGQGKGVNLILPAILSDTFVRAGSSLVALDPKGELAAIAAAHFRRWGYDVHIINPFSIAAILGLGNSRFNPFGQIDPNSDDANDLYKVLAMALHNRQTKGEGAFFDNRCRQYIALYINYAHHVGLGNFATVYDWLILSGTERKELLISMLEDETFENKRQAKGILDRLNGEASKTEESVFSTIEEAIDILNDKRLRASLSDSDFDLRTVAQKPTAIFVCIPFEDLKRYAAWVRLFFSFLLRTLTRHYNVDRKVLVLLDEFAQLAYMDEVPASSAVLRGYNVTLWPIVQGLGQLKSLYGDNWEIFVNSAVIKHWLSAGTDNTTADYIAKRMPQALNFIGNNADGTPKEREKQLLTPNEVMCFKTIICEIAGLDKPANFEKVPYWEWPFSDKNASPNPYYKQ